MKKDTNKTKVIFFYHQANNDLFAFFPEIHESQDMKLCYSHVGQHSECSYEYTDECRPATKEEYKDLATELTNIGYNLEIKEVTNV